MSLEELISRLQKATGPSRELDALIEVQVRRFQAYAVGLNDQQRAHWKPVGNKGEVHEGGTRYHSPAYTFSIDAALTLVPKGWSWHVGLNETGAHAQAVLGRSYPTNKVITQEASRPATALCIAALRAHAALEQG